MRIALLTGGRDPHYALGLASGLLSNSIDIDLIGSADLRYSNIVANNNNIHLYAFCESYKFKSSIIHKTFVTLKYYFRLIIYSAFTDTKIFHIQWEYKLIYFDRTVIIILFKLFNKKLILTAHNINAGERDENYTILDKISIHIMYHIVDHIIVHTAEMKKQLIADYNIQQSKVSIVPTGINNCILDKHLSRVQAKNILGLDPEHKVLLFFGNIAPYKGLDNLISALSLLENKKDDFRLVIAGRIKKNSDKHWEKIERLIQDHQLENIVQKHIRFIPDKEIELFFKAADVSILPYKLSDRYFFQSSIVFLSYGFGLPIIATNVGSLSQDVIDGTTGYICKPDDPGDLANTIIKYFKSELYKNIDKTTCFIYESMKNKFSWKKIGESTCAIYKELL